MTVTMSVFALAGPAWAHEGEEEEPAITLVEEGIAIIAGQPEQMDAIDDKMGGRRRRWRGSSGSSRRHSPRGRARKLSPTAPLRSCSTSRSLRRS
jgi:hypothetical protein